MFCTHCGREIANTVSFCPYCGTAIQKAAAEDAHTRQQENPSQPVAPQQQVPPQAEPPQQHMPSHAENQRQPKKRRSPLFLALGILALIIIAAVVAVIVFNPFGGNTSTEAVAQAVYYETEDDVIVTAATSIVFYDAADEELEDFDLFLRDEAGTITRFHVDGARFTPDELDIPAGRYAMLARDEARGELYTISTITIVETVDDVDDEEDGAVYEDAVGFKPDPNSSGETESEESSLPYQYLLYYEKVLEYQETYGTAALSENELAVVGTALVALVDIDGDGSEELLVVWCADGSWDSERGVDVWRYDAEERAIELVCSEKLAQANDFHGIWIYDRGTSGAAVTWQYVDDSLWTSYTLLAEDGEIVLYSDSAPLASDAFSYYRDGTGVTEDAYNEALSDLSTSTDFVRYDLWVDYEDDSSYDAPLEVIATTEASIAQLCDGVMDTPGGSDDADGADAQAAAYAAYYQLLCDYQTSYGEAATDATVYDYGAAFWYHTGLCFAALADFDGDGIDELVLAYSTSDELDWSIDSYVVEVWGYGETGTELLYSGYNVEEGNGGCTAVVYLATVDGATCIVSGFNRGEYLEEEFLCLADGQFQVVASLGYVVGYASDMTYTEVFTVDGAETDSDAWSAVYEACWADAQGWYLMDYDSDGNVDTAAIDTLTSTLATLEAYA